MSTPLRTILRATALAAAATLAMANAQAVDWGGYLRAGPGASKKDASRACYNLPGDGQHWRLGNECDFYGEFELSQKFKADGVEYKALLMTNLWSPGTDTGGGNTDAEKLDHSKLGINQMYVEGKGYDIAPDTTFWAGKRFHGRADVHIVDKFFTNLSGVGAGFDTPMGGAKLGISYFKTDASSTNSGNRLNVDAYDIAANPGGKLRFVGTLTQGNYTGGTKGLGLIAMHMQDNFMGWGGGNTLWLEYAQGSAGLDGNFGGLSDPSSSKKWRIVESFTFQVGAIGGQTMALWEHDKTDTTSANLASIGGRVSFGLTKNFKLVSELGYSQTKPSGGQTAKLTKFTIAPTLSTGQGFWNRPELRLYVTTAKWNDAAGNVTGQAAFNGKTSGTSFGAQVEMWF